MGQVLEIIAAQARVIMQYSFTISPLGTKFFTYKAFSGVPRGYYFASENLNQQDRIEILDKEYQLNFGGDLAVPSRGKTTAEQKELIQTFQEKVSEELAGKLHLKAGKISG